MRQTVQTGLVSQSQASAAVQPAARLCIIGDGIEALALSALYSMHTAGVDGANDLPIRLLGGVVPPHIEFSSLLSTVDKVIVAQARTAAGPGVNSVTLPDSRSRVAGKSFDPAVCLEGIAEIILSCPATAYGAVAKNIGAYLFDGMTIGLVGAPLFAALQFDYHLRQYRPDIIINIVELDGLFDHAEKVGEGLTLRGLRRRVNISGRSRNETRRAMPLAAALSPSLLPSSNLLERGLFDVDATVRPVLVLSALLGGRIERLANISELLNRSNLCTLTEIERELSKLTFVYKAAMVDFTRILREEARANSDFKPSKSDAPVSAADALAEAVCAAGGSWFAGLTWTYGLAQEVLSRYVGEQLVLISELGRKAEIAMPVLDSVIDLATAVVGYDLRANGRNLAECGLQDATLAELIELLNA